VHLPVLLGILARVIPLFRHLHWSVLLGILIGVEAIGEPAIFSLGDVMWDDRAI